MWVKKLQQGYLILALITLVRVCETVDISLVGYIFTLPMAREKRVTCS